MSYNSPCNWNDLGRNMGVIQTGQVSPPSGSGRQRKQPAGVFEKTDARQLPCQIADAPEWLWTLGSMCISMDMCWVPSMCPGHGERWWTGIAQLGSLPTYIHRSLWDFPFTLQTSGVSGRAAACRLSYVLASPKAHLLFCWITNAVWRFSVRGQQWEPVLPWRG